MGEKAIRVPLYAQVKEFIRTRIEEGTYSANQPLPTEDELIEVTGVSRTTVRKALSDLVNEGLIYRVAGKGTFVSKDPSAVKRSVTDLKLIGIVAPHPTKMTGFEVVCGAERTAKAWGYSILFRDSQDDPECELQDVRDLIEQGAKGIILWPVVVERDGVRNRAISELEKMGIPYVLVDRYFDWVQSDAVVADNFGGMYTLTSHLCNLGYKRIGFAASNSLCINSIHDRFEGYREAVRVHLSEEVDDWVLTEWAGNKDYARSVVEFIERNRLDALVAHNDNHAARLYRILTRHGLSIPGDIALAGFDDSIRSIDPGLALTTVRQSGQDMGRIAVLRTIDRLEGTAEVIPKRRWKRVVPTTLVIRNTCGSERMEKIV